MNEKLTSANQEILKLRKEIQVLKLQANLVDPKQASAEATKMWEE